MSPMSQILVVEDEQHIADGLRFNLEAEGYRVRVVETGEAALELLTADAADFDVMVLDVMLPGKDGFTVMSELRQSGRFVPTLMLTARGHPDDILRGFAAGADDYLAKPFELAILIAQHTRLLRRREWLRKPEPRDAFTFGAKSIRFDLLELRVGEQVFPLTLMEANVLRYLVRCTKANPLPGKRCWRSAFGDCTKIPIRARDRQLHCEAAAVYRRRSGKASAPTDGEGSGLPVSCLLPAAKRQ